MKLLSYRAIIISQFLFLTVSGYGLKEKITRSLIEKGFENVSVKIDSSKLILTIENRLYRYNVDALVVVLKEILSYKKFNRIEALVMKNQVPLVSIKYLVVDTTKLNLEFKSGFTKNILITYDVVDKTNEEINIENNSFNKFDVILYPGFRGQFGDYENPVRAQVNLLTEVRVSFWKGMDLTAQMLIPVYNEFVGENSIRPGVISFIQNFRLSKNYFISSSLGYFTENRYGIDLSLKKIFSNGKLIAGLNIGYTGYLAFLYKKMFYSDPYLWTANINIEYRINEHDLTIGLTAGKFLYGDNSIRFDVNRQFGEVEIGFFFIYSTNRQSNGGFNFSVPLFPPKYFKPSLVRIRTAESFQWEYRVRGELPAMIGVTYKTGNNFIRTIKNFNPDFLTKKLLNEISKH